MELLRIRSFTPHEARETASWSYDAPFDIYDGDPTCAHDLVNVDDAGFGYHALVQGGHEELVGFCCFGAEARVRGQTAEDGTLDIGGGVRPDLVSHRIATQALPMIMAFAVERFGPRRLRTAVATFNERSTRLCRSAGFVIVRRFDRPGREFQELVRTLER